MSASGPSCDNTPWATSYSHRSSVPGQSHGIGRSVRLAVDFDDFFASAGRTLGYRGEVALLIRVVQVVLLLGLALVAVSLVIAVARSETGALETAVLMVMMAGCVAVGAGVTSVGAAVRSRTLARRRLRASPGR
jgi:hypothetical protein